MRVEGFGYFGVCMVEVGGGDFCVVCEYGVGYGVFFNCCGVILFWLYFVCVMIVLYLL